MKIVIHLILLFFTSNAYSNPLPPNYLSALLPPKLPYEEQEDQDSRPLQLCFTIYSNNDKPGENLVEVNLNGQKIDGKVLENNLRITDKRSQESYEFKSQHNRKRSQMVYSPPSTSYGIPVNEKPLGSFKEMFMENLIPPGTSYGVVVGPLIEYQKIDKLQKFDEADKNLLKPTNNLFEDTINSVETSPKVPESLPAQKTDQIPVILSEFFKSKDFKETNSSAVYRPFSSFKEAYQLSEPKGEFSKQVPETDSKIFELPRNSDLYERKTFSYGYDDSTTTAPVKYFDSYGLPVENY